MPRTDPPIEKRAYSLQGTQGAQRTVIVAPGRDRVEVGSHHEGWETRDRTFQSSQDIAHQIHSDVQAGLLHEGPDVSPAFDVGIAEGNSIDTPILPSPKAGKLSEPRLETGPIDERLPSEQGRGQDAGRNR
jgi:hypothetical protein